MRKFFVCMAILYMCCLSTAAQRITRQYDNVSFATALKDLNTAQHQYVINFVYDELEDFRVTKRIRNLSVPDAIRQLIGFYPIKMTQLDNVLVVECTQKAPVKMIGQVVDERQRPIDYANVALLSTTDSSFITGGVSNENGLFVIPCEAKRVIVKVSCVGYKTMYRTCATGRIGAITLRENAIRLDGVQVKAMRHNIKMGREGMVVDIHGTELSKIGTASDVLGEMPRVNVDADGTVSVFAKGQPLIYVNSRKVTDLTELKRIKSDDIKNVEVITSPSSQYDATVRSVIRIRTIAKQGDGWSGEGFATVSYNKWWGSSQLWSSTYRTGRIEVTGEVWGTTKPGGEDNWLTNEIQGEKHIFITQHTPLAYRSKGAGAETKFNYTIDNNNETGLAYDLQYMGTGKGHTTAGSRQEISEDGQPTARVYNTDEITDTYAPVHNLNAYYIGKLGKLGIDFNATYLWKKQGRDMRVEEQSDDLESRNVHTRNRQHSQMAAGKLILAYPVWKGTVDLGSEFTFSQVRGTYANEERYVDAANTKIREQNVAGFAEYALPLGDFHLRAGVRYEHVKTDYYSFGQWEQEPSRRYADWYPSASVAWNKDRWALSLAYTRKTNRPSYSSLRSEVQYDNRYTYEGGNPYLRPCVISNVDLNMVYGWLSLNAGYTYRNKPIIWVPTRYQDRDVIFLRNVNFRHQQELYASVVASPRWGWYNPMLEIDYTQSFLSTEGFDIGRLSHKPCFNFRLNNRFNITSTLKAFVNMRYKTSRHDDLQHTKPFGRLDVRFSQSLLRESLEISLFANDLLRTDKEQWTMQGSHVVLTKDCYGYSRSIGLSVSYNFNVAKSKYKGTGAGNAEKNRL